MKKLLIGLLALGSISISASANSIENLLKVKDCTITVKEDIFFERGERSSILREDPSGFSLRINVSSGNLNSRRRLIKDRQITISSHDLGKCVIAEDESVESICATNLINPLAKVTPKQLNELSHKKLEISCKDEGVIVDL